MKFESDNKTTDREDTVDAKVKKITIFDHWKNLTQQKEGYKEDDADFVSSYSPYMINRFGSMVNAFLPLVAEIERYPDIPKETHHQFYHSLLPKRYVKFDYLKSKKDIDPSARELIGKYFECGRRDIDLALKLIDQSTIDKIKKMYGGTGQ